MTDAQMPMHHRGVITSPLSLDIRASVSNIRASAQCSHLFWGVSRGRDGLADVAVLLQRPPQGALVVLARIHNLCIVCLCRILACKPKQLNCLGLSF